MNNEQATWVIHHDNCPDGVLAYVIAEKFLTVRDGRAPNRWPMNYGGELPDVAEGDEVFIVDFCLPLAELQALSNRAAVTVFDHHESLKQDLWDWVDGGPGTGAPDRFNLSAHGRHGTKRAVYDSARSGAGITWDQMFGGDRPTVVDYVEDKDLWLHRLPMSRDVGTLWNVMPTGPDADLALWREMLDDGQIPLGSLTDLATGSLLAHEKQMADARRFWWWATAPDGTRIPCVQIPYMYGSNAAEVIAEDAMCDMGMYFTPGMPGGHLFCGVRGPGSREFAEALGGGGHPNAAGFRLESWDGWTHEQRNSVADTDDAS